MTGTGAWADKLAAIMERRGGRLPASEREARALELAEVAAAWLDYLDNNPAPDNAAEIAAQFKAAMDALDETTGGS